jgi:hypothetical protein
MGKAMKERAWQKTFLIVVGALPLAVAWRCLRPMSGTGRLEGRIAASLSHAP